MYGLVNKGTRDLICRAYGDAAWERIARTLGLEADIPFTTMAAYPDELTYGMIATASAQLGVPGSQLLEEFGAYSGSRWRGARWRWC